MEVTGLSRWTIQSYIVTARKERRMELQDLKLRETDYCFTTETGKRIKARDCSTISYGIGRWSLHVTVTIVYKDADYKIPIENYREFIVAARKAHP
jgi:hypothetical protein